MVELPPGPPVLSTLVAEIYGPDQSRRMELARRVKAILESTPGVVDVDWMVEAPGKEWLLEVDQTRAALAGVSPAMVTQSVSLALSGMPVGTLHPADTFEPVPLVVRWPREARSDIFAMADLRIPSQSGVLVPAAAVVRPVDASVT